MGQEPIVRVLKNSVDQGKIAHAYLFSGPRGVGKTSTARILAKALNCSQGLTSAPCGSCPFCISITDGSSVDVMEIDGASNNSVNDIRDLRERVKYVPSGGRYKVYIIDETHMLSDAAFNALLKTLEEPPPHVVFVLATTAPRKIPQTVLSRCQHLLFRRIPGSLIKDRLKKISDAEGIAVSNPALEMIARAADGSLRDALTILDQLSSFSTDITETDVKDLLGVTDFRLISQLSVALIEGRRENIIRITEDLVEKGTDVKSLIKELVQYFRDLLVASVTKKPEELVDITPEEMESVKHILTVTSEDQLTLMLSELIKAEIDIRSASYPRLAFEMSLLKISFLSEMKPIKEIIEHFDDYIKQNQIRHAQGTEMQKAAKNSEQLSSEEHQKPTGDILSVEEVSPSPSKIMHKPANSDKDQVLTEEVWERALRKIDPPLSSKLSKAAIKLDGNRLVLALNGGDSIFADSIKKNTGLIENILSEELGSTVKIDLEIIKKKAIRKKDLKEEVLADPTIKEALELFGGRVVDVYPITDEGIE
jgi:DNA polymerase-3 subunit gamma/tau